AVALPDGGARPADLTSLWLADASLVTSGVDYRRWRLNGRAAHHIIDPRTGETAATDLLTATVLLRHAAQADAVATAALVLGRAAASDWLAARQVPALLVGGAGEVVRTPAWMRNSSGYSEF
ncbi:MAG: FAD:protein FMN transferase, partial [Anaerolineales bacterium]|nr:FAD:protein FMN transferase [Anaerolineales bacterium]